MCISFYSSSYDIRVSPLVLEFSSLDYCQGFSIYKICDKKSILTSTSVISFLKWEYTRASVSQFCLRIMLDDLCKLLNIFLYKNKHSYLLILLDFNVLRIKILSYTSLYIPVLVYGGYFED